VAYDAVTGQERWAALFNSGHGGYAAAIVLSPDAGTVYVTGGSRDGYDTVAYRASDGSELWVAGYHGPVDGSNGGTAIGVSPDGSRLFVTGQSAGESPYHVDYATVAYDAATGGELWVSRYDGPAAKDDIPTGVGVSLDGATVVVTGTADGSGTSGQYATIAYNVATGDVRWLQLFDSPVHDQDEAVGLDVSLDGSKVYVAGSGFDGGVEKNYTTIAYDLGTGAVAWTSRFIGPGRLGGEARSLGESPDGAVLYVTGDIGVDYRGDDMLLLAIDAATGRVRWATRAGEHRFDTGMAVAVAPDGRSVFTAVRLNAGEPRYDDYGTFAYSV
jgi:DNA-binding beta-propeller fold protein YncE